MRAVPSLIVFLLLGSCLPHYQWSPYAEVQYRDETFTPEGGASNYGGETYLIGARAVPPMVFSPLAVAQLTGNSNGGTSVIDTERMGTLRADLAAERAKVTTQQEKITHLEHDLAAERTEKAAFATALAAEKKELTATKIKLAEVDDWWKHARELMEGWGLMGSIFVLLIAAYCFVAWTKSPKKAKK